jgi:cytochrome c oxidase accessory protein FixG
MKWSLFVLVSSIISHSFIAYFTGSRQLVEMIQGPPSQNLTYFLLVAFFTLVSLFNFTWFREQFCVIMCPYGRIQSVFLEPTSLAIVYDEKRGEPRRSAGLAKNTKLGDCVGCNRCVEVCPTGIDIRNGIQMECIACTACIDACDDIMAKVKKPKGLISYRTLSGTPFKVVNFKTIIYSFFVFSSISGLAYNLKNRDTVNISVLRAIDTPYTLTNDENGVEVVINHFRLHLTNQTGIDSKYTISLSDEAKSQGVKLVLAQNPLELLANRSGTFHLFIHVPSSKLKNENKLEIKFSIRGSKSNIFDREMILLGPSK